jgi:uncharacterized membrane protein SpoIIM required for sporulation
MKDRGARWDRLRLLLDRFDKRGVDAFTPDELKELCRLYRQVTIDLSQARTDGADPGLVRYLNHLTARAHGHVYSSRRLDLRPLLTFVTGGFPRLVRRRARPILAAAAVFLLTSLASFLAVLHNPEIAYSLFDERVVEYENVRLEREEGEYRGNFTFTVGESPLVGLAIIANNIRVAIVVFALGTLLCLPAVLLLVMNGRMLGTLSGLVWQHGFLLPFYSLILCHGVLELTAICIAGGGGLMLGWSLIAPGELPRRDALQRAAGDAFGLLAGSALLLVVAGMIEAHVTPHFPAEVRWPVAGASALFLMVYFGWVGRREGPVGARDAGLAKPQAPQSRPRAVICR